MNVTWPARNHFLPGTMPVLPEQTAHHESDSVMFSAQR